MSLGSSPSSVWRPPHYSWEKKQWQAKIEITFRLAQKPRGLLFPNPCHLKQNCPLSLTASTNLERKFPWHRAVVLPAVWCSWTERTTILTRLLKKAAFWNTLPMADALCTVANWLPLSVLIQLKGQPGSVQAGDRNHAGYLNREEIIYRILTRKLKWPKGDMERLSPRQQLWTGAVT